jgi:hypothetical protein
MNVLKEFYEISSLVKEKINHEDFFPKDDMFNKEYLKSLLLNDPRIVNIINLLKDKHKIQNEKNNNIFHLLKNIGKKQQRENRALILSLGEFSLFYNEPKYINQLNMSIYEKISEFVTEMSREYKLISIINGKSNEEVFKEEVFDKFLSYKKSMTHKFPNTYEEILKIKNENLNFEMNNSSACSSHNIFSFRLKVYDAKFLKQTFEELINSLLDTDEETINNKKRRDLIEATIKESKKNKLLEIIKTRIPHSLRRKIYLFLMGVEINTIESSRIIDDNILLVDYLITEDVQRSTANENYFLFEDNLKNVLLQLMRDKDILTEIQGVRPIILYSINNSNSSSSKTTATPYPSSGLIPFQGIGFQCAPFTYISTDTSEIYLMFRNFFCKYLSFLTSFSTNKNSILSLIYTFNQIFTTSPELKDIFIHFKSLKIEINSIVYFWIVSCFAEILSPENVFHLYDIIIITDNLLIFVLFSLSILYSKKKIILNLQTKEEIIQVFENLKYESIQVLDCISKFFSSV